MDFVKSFPTKHKILSARIFALLTAIIATTVSLSFKKATTLSSSNVNSIRGIFGFLALTPVIYRSGSITWKESSYDKNTYLVRGIIALVGNMIGALALKVTDIHIYTVISATNVPITVLFSRILGVK